MGAPARGSRSVPNVGIVLVMLGAPLLTAAASSPAQAGVPCVEDPSPCYHIEPICPDPNSCYGAEYNLNNLLGPCPADGWWLRIETPGDDFEFWHCMMLSGLR